MTEDRTSRRQRLLWLAVSLLSVTGVCMTLLVKPPGLGVGVQLAALTLAVAAYAAQERDHRHVAQTIVVQHVDHLELPRQAGGPRD